MNKREEPVTGVKIWKYREEVSSQTSWLKRASQNEFYNLEK